ncbi:MAG: DedA family protein [Candidatus Pacebacteria bacterium]|nr:DedA family protein [Candidatus Paceibacterota bacterium]
MEQWLIEMIHVHNYTFYGIVAVASFAEGPILAMLCGVLYKLGLVPFTPIYLALMIGDLFGDTFWYWVGYYFGHPFVKRYGKFFSLTESGVASVTHVFHKYHNSILLISKMTMGLGFALVTLVTAGIVKIPFKRYIFLNFIGQFFWTAFLLVVGYFLGDLYIRINGVLGGLFVAAIIVFIFFGLIGWGKYMKGRMSEAAK